MTPAVNIEQNLLPALKEYMKYLIDTLEKTENLITALENPRQFDITIKAVCENSLGKEKNDARNPCSI